MPEPHTLVLELSRADDAGDPYAFKMDPQVYVRRFADKTVKHAELPWDAAFVAAIEALRAPRRDPEVVQRVGNDLRAFLERTGWSGDEAALIEAVDRGRPVVVTIRSTAAELYTLPWELLALGQTMRHVGELPNVTVRYEWPGAKTLAEAPSPRPEGGRILLAYSHAGGKVLANDHLSAIQEACDDAGHGFDVDRDVLPGASRRSLGEALAAAREKGEPIAVLQLLCHGGALGSTFGLMLDADAPGEPAGVDADRLASLLARYADMIRLVVVIACDSGNTGSLGNQMGSVAQAIHRAGVAAVVASRYPISVTGAGEFVRVFYRELLVPPRSVEEAFVAARQRLSEVSTRLDWASVQLYAREDDGFDTRPIVVAPYRGLLPFERRHERFFFGRNGKDKQGKAREVDELVQKLGSLADTPGSARFIVVAGDSGTGKSSMVLAGVVPSLEAKGWVWEKMRPGSTPMATLDAALAALDGQLQRKRAAGEAARSLLVVDQLEEVFTLLAKAEDRTAFVRRLWERASLADESRLSVVVTLRIDFVGRCGEVVLDQGSGLRLDKVAYDPAHQVLVAQMDDAQLREAIEKPAHRVGVVLQAGLPGRILEGVDREPGALPLMQHTLRLLWERREGRTLTQAKYDADDFGGVAGALNKHADGVVKRFDEKKRRLARRLLVRLARLGDDHALDTRRRVPLDDLRPRRRSEAGRFDDVLKDLVDQRLLVTSGKGKEQTVEVAHEALIRRWDLLRGWLKAEQDLELQRRLRRLGAIAAGALAVAALMGLGVWWALGQRDAARRASVMAGARELLANGRTGLASMVLLAVRDPEKERGWPELATDTLMHWNWIPISTLHHKGLVSFAAWSPDGKRVVSLSPGQAAQIWNADNTGAPIVLTGHKGGIPYAAWSPDGRRIVTASDDKNAGIWNTDGTGAPIIFMAHKETVLSAAWSPDGRRIVTISKDGTAHIWNADRAGASIVLEGGTRTTVNFEGKNFDVHNFAVWSPDGRRVIVGPDEHHNVRIWNVDDANDPIVLRHEAPVFSAVWSPDGSRVVTTSYAHTGRIWNADRVGEPIVFFRSSEVRLAAWSPDGRRIITFGADESARIRNADGSGDPVVLRHGSYVNSARWSPDGRRIVTASSDKTVRIWNTDDPGDTVVLKDHEEAVRFAAWSPDGKRILSWSVDRTVRIWDATVRGTDGPFVLQGNNPPVRRAAWSPDGKHILTVTGIEPARVWSSDGTGGPVALPEGDPAWSPDGRQILLVSNPPKVWSPDGAAAPVALGHHEDTWWAISARSTLWNPDSKRIAWPYGHNISRIWRADGLGDPIILKGKVGEVGAWSPDGRRIVTVSEDGTALIWNADGTGAPTLLDDHAGKISGAQWSPDGKRIAAWSNRDRVMRIWSADGVSGPVIVRGTYTGSITWSPDSERILEVSPMGLARIRNIDGTGPHVLKGRIDLAEWSPDGKRIVALAGEKSARIWNGDGTGAPLVLEGHEGIVFCAAWSPDGKRIVTGSYDFTARVWNADGTGAPLVLKGHDGSVTSVAWSPDGKRIVTTSVDRTARVWLPTIPALQQALLNATTDCLTVEQRQTYLLESEAEAHKGYEACERSHHRTPYFDAPKAP